MKDMNVVHSLGVSPAQMQPGSRFPLQVLGWITSLWAFRCNRSRGECAIMEVGLAMIPLR